MDFEKNLLFRKEIRGSLSSVFQDWMGTSNFNDLSPSDRV